MAALATAIAVSCGLAEVTVRIVAPQPTSWLPIFRKHPDYPISWHQANADVTVDTGESRWRVVTDASGLRVPPSPVPIEPNAVVAACLGDSFTFGYAVNYEDSFVGALQSRTARTRFINVGCGGHGPTQYRMVFESILARGTRPAHVLVGVFLGNDFYDCIWDKTFRDDQVTGGGLKNFLRVHSHAYRLSARVFHTVTSSGPPEVREFGQEMYSDDGWTREPLRSAARVFGEELARIERRCRDVGASLHVVLIPTFAAVAGAKLGASGPAANDMPARKADEILSAIGIQVHDASPALRKFSGEQLYFRHDGHLTPRGNEVLAEDIARRWPREFGP